MSEEKTVERLKDFNKPTFVCQHLDKDPKSNLGFNVPADIEKDREAWCDKCEEMLQQEGSWTKRALKFAKIRHICRCCFAEIKEAHYNDRGCYY